MQKIEVPTQGDAPPRDAYGAAYAIHFLLGAGNLLPWNALITAVDYFGRLYPDRNVEKAFAVAYMAASVVVMAVLVCWRGVLGLRLRLNAGFAIFILSLALAVAVNWSRTGPGPEGRAGMGAYGATVGAALICGLADGLVGGSLIGFAGKMPARFMQAVFAGTASSGVLVSILRIVTKSSLPQTPQGLRRSTVLYFLVTCAVLLACIVACNFLFTLDVIVRHRPDGAQKNVNVNPSAVFWSVAGRLRWAAVGVFLIYTVTLSIYPGFIADDLESDRLRDWYPLLLIAFYNASDFAGKCLAGIRVPTTVGAAVWGCAARLLFYPLFAASVRGPRWVRSEAPVMALTALLGLTNGYLTSAVMMLAPKSVAAGEAEVAAMVMALFLGLGLLTGSVLGWVWII